MSDTPASDNGNGNNPETKSGKKFPVVPLDMLFPFILVTTLFSLWGFANDITNPMVAAFRKILLISNFQSSLVQFAFYGGYCVMAIPAALFIKRFSYKSGIVVGLTLYAAAALFFPIAGQMMAFWAFLLAYFVLTCGLSFLETTANPYILSMGPEETSTQRLNFAQSFNPMGSLIGMAVAMHFILNSLSVVNQDKDLAPVLADKARNRVATVAEAGDLAELTKIAEDIDLSKAKGLDDARWQVIQGMNLGSWVPGADKIADNIEKGTAVDWTAVQQEMQETRERIVGVLVILADPDAGDSDKWMQIQDANLDASLESKAREEINARIAAGKSIKWSDTPLLAGLPDEEQARRLVSTLDKEEWTKVQQADLNVLQGPYFAIGIVVLVFLVVFIFAKLPQAQNEDDKTLHIGPTLLRLLNNGGYIEGVIAQAFYVGAQIMCWTFIIQYAGKELEMPQGTAQLYNIVAMVIFCSSRFVCTFLLRFIRPGALLGILAVVAMFLVAGTIFIEGMCGLYCLVAVSACMSLMFPTIYGIALKGLGDDAKLGAAGLIMAIGGGCLMPPMQAWIMDQSAFDLGFMELSSMRASFVLPLICFVVIAIYGFRTHKYHEA